MFRRTIDSFFTTVILFVLVPFIVFSAVRTRIGLARPRTKTNRPHSSQPPAPPANEPVGEFHFDRAVEAYENLIDSVIAEDRA